MKDFDWDISPEEFICVEPVGLIIGGIARNYSYLDEVEILAPGMDCTIPEESKFDAMTGKKVSTGIANYPAKVIGASAGFFQGQNIVCGGAIENYTECEVFDAEGSNICDRNIDCVTTKG